MFRLPFWNSSDQQKINVLNLLAVLSGVLITMLMTFQLTTNWQWSILMDDIALLRDYSSASAPSAVRKLVEEFFAYWRSGRLFPVKYVMNLVEYRYLTGSPLFLHLVHTSALLAALGIGSWGALKRTRLGENGWKYLLLFVGLGLAQRPLLDIAGLCSIAEVWTVLLLAWALFLFPEHPVGYRCVLLACSFSKEPAVTVFLASGFVHLKGLAVHRDHRFQRSFSAFIDLAIFAALALLMRHVQRGGTYLAGYNLWQIGNIKRFMVGLAKGGFGLIPALVLVAYTIKKKEFAWREILRGSDTEWFCLCFALTYLALVTPRGIPGYLLIPPAFALWRAACGMMVRTSTTWIQLPRLWSVAVSALFLLCASVSLTRYVRYARSINDSTLAFQLIQMTHSPRLVVSNATEASRNATAMAQAEGSPVTFVSIDDARDPQSALQNFKGDVVLIEFTQYFGKIPDDFLEACRSSVGEWTMTMDKGFYRIFYGVRR